MIVFKMIDGTEKKIDGNMVDMEQEGFYSVFKDAENIAVLSDEEVESFHYEK